ncbi:MAG: hypothetical protein PSX80_12640 [bacterium]|nr:hypothetical protein [bacterium]
MSSERIVSVFLGQIPQIEKYKFAFEVGLDLMYKRVLVATLDRESFAKDREHSFHFYQD